MCTDLKIHLHPTLSRQLGPSLVFHRWLPRIDNRLDFTYGAHAIRLWTEIDCLDSIIGIDTDSIERYVNPMVSSVHVEVVAAGVSDVLAEYIQQRGTTQNYGLQSEHKDEFNTLARSIYCDVVGAINRFIEAVRVLCGQYWALPLPVNEGQARSFFVAAKATVQSEIFAPVLWDPPLGDIVHVTLNTNCEKFIDQNSWSKIGEYLQIRPERTLAFEMITYADQLGAEGHRRAALVHAVGALEIAVSQFLVAAQSSTDLAKRIREDTIPCSLPKLGERLGLRGTLAALLPLLLSAERLPRDVLELCKTAVETRNTVVHKGQRDVSAPQMHTYLDAIRSAVNSLVAQSGKP